MRRFVGMLNPVVAVLEVLRQTSPLIRSDMADAIYIRSNGLIAFKKATLTRTLEVLIRNGCVTKSMGPAYHQGRMIKVPYYTITDIGSQLAEENRISFLRLFDGKEQAKR